MTRATRDDPRWAATARQDEAARRRELVAAGKRSIGENIEEGARLAAVAAEFLQALDRPNAT